MNYLVLKIAKMVQITNQKNNFDLNRNDCVR